MASIVTRFRWGLFASEIQERMEHDLDEIRELEQQLSEAVLGLPQRFLMMKPKRFA